MSYRFADSKTVWHIQLLCVQWRTPDDGQRNCPKHVEYYSKNKFEKLVHLLGFIIRIYHDPRSPERQKSVPIWTFYFLCPNYDRATRVPVLSTTWFSHDFIFSFFKPHSLIIVIMIINTIHPLLPKSIKCSLFCSCFKCSSVCNSNLSHAYYMSLAI